MRVWVLTGGSGLRVTAAGFSSPLSGVMKLGTEGVTLFTPDAVANPVDSQRDDHQWRVVLWRIWKEIIRHRGLVSLISRASLMALRNDAGKSMEAYGMARKRAVRNTPARFQVEIMREELDEMERLRELGGLSSKKELLNNALTLLKWVVRQRQRGYSIASVDENGVIHRELEMPYLESVGLRSQHSLKVVHSAAPDDQDKQDEAGAEASQLATASSRSR